MLIENHYCGLVDHADHRVLMLTLSSCKLSVKMGKKLSIFWNNPCTTHEGPADSD